MLTPAGLPPLLALAAAAGADWLASPELARTAAAAITALAVSCVTLPRRRRRLAARPAALVLLAPLPFVAALLFPGSDGAPRIAVDAARFLLLASLLESLLLVAVVSVWERVARPLPRIFLDVLTGLTLAAALVVILYESGVDAGNLFAGSALVTAGVGFALKDTLGNVFAGLAIHAERPFEVGDWIQYDPNPAHVGRVLEINWRATKVITLDEACVIIPNGQLAQASIRNFTKPEPWSRRSLFVVTPYEVPPQQVQAIILDAVRGGFGVLDHPPPSVVTNAFTERGVEHWVRLFTSDFDKRDAVDGGARDRIWYALTRHGIALPVATHAVRLTPLPASVPAPEADGAARREACLRGVDVFAALAAEQIHELAGCCAERIYAAGEQVIRQGDPGSSLFVILAGRVEVTAREGALPPVSVAVLGAGDYFGEMSLLTGAGRLATVTAIEEARLVEVGKEPFGRLVAAHPQLVERLGAALRRRLAGRAEALATAVPGRTGDEPPDLLDRIREFFGMEARRSPGRER